MLRPFFTGKNFSILHSLTPVVVVDLNVSSNPHHPLNRKVIARIKAEKSNEPRLIITALATKKRVSKHSVVRNKAVRRVREAVYEALKVKGYGKEGELLRAPNSRERLVGTLSFSVTMDSVVSPWDDLKKEVEVAVDKFITISGKAMGAQTKTASHTRFGLERGRGSGRMPLESSIEFSSDSSHGRSLGGIGERALVVTGRHLQGQCTTAGSFNKPQLKASADKQEWKQRNGSRISSSRERSEANIAQKSYNTFQQRGDGRNQPAVEARPEKSNQRPVNGCWDRKKQPTGAMKEDLRIAFPKWCSRGLNGGPRFK